MVTLFHISCTTSDALSSVAVAAMKLKNPFILIGDASNKEDLEQYIQSLWGNELGFILTKNFTMDNSLKVENTTFDAMALRELWLQFQRWESEFYTILGVNNNQNPDKNERLLVDEINVNNEEINSNIDVRLQAREEFCEKVNKIWGLNLNVKVNSKTEIKKESNYKEQEEI